MFPTPVGMNRDFDASEVGQSYVPHTRGDEPAMKEAAAKDVACSPHPWG